MFTFETNFVNEGRLLKNESGKHWRECLGYILNIQLFFSILGLIFGCNAFLAIVILVIFAIFSFKFSWIIYYYLVFYMQCKFRCYIVFIVVLNLIWQCQLLFNSLTWLCQLSWRSFLFLNSSISSSFYWTQVKKTRKLYTFINNWDKKYNLEYNFDLYNWNLCSSAGDELFGSIIFPFLISIWELQRKRLHEIQNDTWELIIK